ncbi:excisionase family DNA-binding protein [Halobacillus sp. Marseille-Q1614]|uniref:excisionase family DNA-binding protein n=1 Tax=Halobacillus sp. Marseille-Q1614 TaxID=2709134 RepID=UPI00156FCBCE|nr:excisionase family DNA-binding protein [Halobacillus sp. Marseille-Q1614]
MYLTVRETAEYLDVPVTHVERLVQTGKIRSVFDGEKDMINKQQFDTYFQQIEKYRESMIEYLSEPLPKDRDIKDED